MPSNQQIELSYKDRSLFQDPVATLVARLKEQGWSSTSLRDRVRSVNTSSQATDPIEFDIVDADGFPFFLAAIEKVPRDEAKARLIGRLLDSDTVTMGVLFGEKQSPPQFFRRLFTSDRIESVAAVEPWSPVPSELGLLVAGTGQTRHLRPISDRIENLLFEVHSHMRDVDALHAPEALDELCKLLLLKTWDERVTEPGAALNLQRAAYGSLDEYAAVARRIYLECLSQQHGQWEPNEDLTNRLWGRIELSNAALVRCLDQLEPYSFNETALDVKGRAFQNVFSPSARSGMGQYFTPENVGQMMIAALAPKKGERLLDPFVGSAHFLALAAAHLTAGEKRPNEQMRAYCHESLFGIEKSERMVRVALTTLMLRELAGVRLVCGDSLSHTGHHPAHRLGGFDLVCTNPPFGSMLRADAIRQLGEYATAARRRSVPIEVLGLEQAARFLRPGGRLAIVLPDGVLGNNRTLNARRWAVGFLAIRAIVSLPVEAFSPFGANVKTSVLFARRLMPGEAQNDRSNVFLAQVDHVGCDASGRPHGVDELPKVTEALCAFLAKEGW